MGLVILFSKKTAIIIAIILATNRLNICANLFNLFILATLDLYYRRRKLFSQVGRSHLPTGFMSFALTGIVFIALLFPTGYHFMQIGIEMYILGAFYLIGMKFPKILFYDIIGLLKMNHMGIKYEGLRVG